MAKKSIRFIGLTRYFSTLGFGDMRCVQQATRMRYSTVNEMMHTTSVLYIRSITHGLSFAHGVVSAQNETVDAMIISMMMAARIAAGMELSGSSKSTKILRCKVADRGCSPLSSLSSSNVSAFKNPAQM